MEEWKVRVVNEFKELNNKVEKLWNFVHKDPKFEKLDNTERKLLLRQLTGMTIYLDALYDRLEYYKINVKDKVMALHSPYDDDIHSDSYYDNADTRAADGDDLDGDKI